MDEDGDNANVTTSQQSEEELHGDIFVAAHDYDADNEAEDGDDSEDEDGEEDVTTSQQSEEESNLESHELEHWPQPPREPAQPWVGIRVLGGDHDFDQVFVAQKPRPMKNFSKTQPGTILDQMPNEAQYDQRGLLCGPPAYYFNFDIFAIILKIQNQCQQRNQRHHYN